LSRNNIGYACTREQCEAGLGDKLAFRFVKLDGATEDITYAMLEKESNQMANELHALGLNHGDVFFTFLPKCRAQVVTFLASLKHRLITGTLFANFGDEAVLDRLGDASAKAIITKKVFTKSFRKFGRNWSS